MLLILVWKSTDWNDWNILKFDYNVEANWQDWTLLKFKHIGFVCLRLALFIDSMPFLFRKIMKDKWKIMKYVCQIMEGNNANCNCQFKDIINNLWLKYVSNFKIKIIHHNSITYFFLIYLTCLFAHFINIE